MANNDSTTKFKADISELKAAFQQAQRQVRVLNSEFKASTAALDDWSKDADGLNAKLKQLNGVLDAENKKLDSLAEQYKLTAAEQGANSKGAQDLLVKLNNQKAAVANVEKQIKSYTQKLSDVKSGSETAQSATKKLSDTIAQQEDDLTSLKSEYSNLILTQGKSSAEAKETAQRIKELSTELAANKAKLSDVESAADKCDNTLDDLGDSAKDAGDGFTIAKGAIATFIGNGLSALVSAAGNAISNIANLAAETREYRNEMAKLDTAYESAGHSTETAAATYKDLYGILGDEGAATEAAQQLAKISKTEEDLQANTRILTGVMGEYGKSIPTEGLAEGMAATAAMGSVQGVLADALEWQGINLDDYNEKLGTMSTEEERAAYIQKTLTDLYGESADKYRENAAAIIEDNQATADLTATQAELGAKVEPITTTLKQGFTDLLTKIIELVDGADFTKLEEAVESGFSWLIDTGLPAIKSGFQWIIENKDGLIAGITGIGAAFLAFKVVTIIQSVVSALKGMTLAQAALNLVMSMNPIGLVVAAIAGLIAAFVMLWNKSEAFREFWIGLWEKVKTITNNVVTAIAKFFTNLWTGIKKTFSGVAAWFKDIFTTAWQNIKNAWGAVTNWFSGIWQGIKSIFSAVGGWFSEKFTTAWQNIKTAFSAVGEFFGSVWEAVKKPFASVASWFKDTFSEAWQKVKDVFSTGGKIFDGIKEGIASTFTTVVNGIIGGINKVIAIPFEAINGALKKIKNISIAGAEPFKNLISLIDVPQIPLLERGGVLKKGQVGLLEGKGAEAVIPLEKNTGWLDEIANRLSQKIGIAANSGFATAGAAAGGVTYNFYQTNNSPQALDRLEIYRQSKNLLSLRG